MKKNTKGFTLIELLAVIVVLAVIALIATPIVLNLVKEAKVGAARESVTSYMKAVENSVLKEMVNGKNVTFCETYNIDGKTLSVPKDATNTDKCVKSLTVDVSGNVPSAGTVKMEADGSNITAEGVKVDTYGPFTYTQSTGTSDGTKS